ncbi:uncharacterized protein PGTG_02088 [Puccinia graminis f. sp. tritici CRL 75-36-700-3]|uniref:CCHC-type domain-containing protein n=1 Tax=Puccinia graminis f. sp. tritici (strain CRL 75-36-700-3 / race SCCL) TaxID=418459 RepID=E3JX52_PUCGT|nr:uncharacterized protein PGTG_02088 [Puccinia graminis f. sp. tritici CRL 75-36-700-3]EFP76627.1 hypothetical protein PGTG_02088 [Puccinia graminis f. sp. tritici CRL 75-36-700-3]
MATVRQIQNVANLISSIQVLDGTDSCLDDVLGFQNKLDIVKGTLPCPKEASKTEPSATRSVKYTKGYSPSDITTDWDALSDLACYTIRLTLSNPLAQRYCKGLSDETSRGLWNARHNPNEVIALWIGQIRVAADNLLSIEELPTDRQIADRLVGGLDPTWSNVRDSIVYTATEMSLDNVIGALEAHEVSLNGTKAHDVISAASASTKRIACSTCGKQGHKSSDCYQNKNKGKAKAGAVTTVQLGGYDSGSFDDEDEIGVIYE